MKERADGQGHRLVAVLDHPAQHFGPAFRLFDGSDVVEFSVLYHWANRGPYHDVEFGRDVSWDVDLLDGYRWTSLETSGPSMIVRAFRTLNRLDPDVVMVFGWARSITRTAIVWAKLRRRRLLLYGDSTIQHSQQGKQRGLIAKLQLRLLMYMASAAYSMGAFNRAFYESVGMSSSEIYDGVHPFDIDLYSGAPREGSSDREVIIGFAGKLLAIKGVDELLEALARVDTRAGWRAVIVGDGAEREHLERLAERLRIADRVRFTGFLNQTEVADFLRTCDIVVVPSRRDSRVLVAAEAMAAGALVIVSDKTAVWGPGDLLEDGVTGFVYPSGDAAALAARLEAVVDDAGIRTSIAGAGSLRAAAHGPGAFVKGLEVALGKMCG